MRIIAGSLKGRVLAKSDHIKSLRPTTDRSREALFNILNSSNILAQQGFSLKKSKILDLCCGTGAVAFEALSWGASSAVLIDNNKIHLDLAKQNAKLLGVESQVQFFFSNVKTKLPDLAQKFDLIFIDPPYDDDYCDILLNLKNSNYLQKNQIIVVEHRHLSKPIIADFLLELDRRRYGISEFHFFTPKDVNQL